VVIGEPVAQDQLRGGRHGVLVLDRDDCLWFDVARTRRGARKRYLDVLDWLPLDPQRAHAPPGAEVELIRVERERVAQRLLIHVGGDAPPDAGMREPRRPRPSAGGAAAVADPPDA
jgi:hypothetical protein